MSSTDASEHYFDLISRKWVQRIEQAIIKDAAVALTDVVGMERFQDDLVELLQYPESICERKFPVGGTLLYGPLGTGKTFLSKAVASQCKQTFIWIHASDLLSEWIGLTEKSITSLFKVARQRRPSIVCIDDIDLLCKDENNTESEQIRRVKVQFLRQIQREENRGTYLLGTTNKPWKLDPILRQRFSKRIFVPLPNLDERVKLFQAQYPAEIYHKIDESEWLVLAEKTDNYSAVDISYVCRRALMRPVRRLVSSIYFKLIPNPRSDGPNEVWTCCLPEDEGAIEQMIDTIPADQICEPPMIFDDIQHELSYYQPKSNAEALPMLMKFREEYGGNLL